MDENPTVPAHLPAGKGRVGTHGSVGTLLKPCCGCCAAALNGGYYRANMETGIVVRAATFADRVEQFNPVTVNYREERRLGKKGCAPVPMRQQQALQASALRQTSKQSDIISSQPAIEGSKVAAFEGKQQPNRDNLARIQLGLRMFGDCAHLVVYPAEQFDDKVFGGHSSYLQQFGDYWFYGVRDLFSTSAIGY